MNTYSVKIKTNHSKEIKEFVNSWISPPIYSFVLVRVFLVSEKVLENVCNTRVIF